MAIQPTNKTIVLSNGCEIIADVFEASDGKKDFVDVVLLYPDGVRVLLERVMFSRNYSGGGPDAIFKESTYIREEDLEEFLLEKQYDIFDNMDDDDRVIDSLKVIEIALDHGFEIVNPDNDDRGYVFGATSAEVP